VGGYGGKSPERIANLAAIMARRTGRPVKAVFSRTEDFIATQHRISYDCHCKVGVKKDGTITALDTRILAHWGSDTASPCTAQAAGIMTGGSLLYRNPNTRPKPTACSAISSAMAP
jgi:CO/xanthine dehydrogenase Mo-binding subunit